MTLSRALRVAALVLFIIAALIVLVLTGNMKWFYGLLAIGLACWVGSTL